MKTSLCELSQLVQRKNEQHFNKKHYGGTNMKKVKKMLSFVLAMVLILVANTSTAFATESDYTSREPIKHTIELTVEPGEEDNGIMPLDYDEYDSIVLKGITHTTDKFYVEERYMAFEAYATDITGNSVDDKVRIEFRDWFSDGLLGAINLPIDGISKKLDWIDGGRGWYYFSISNSTNYHLSVHITYYSWK